MQRFPLEREGSAKPASIGARRRAVFLGQTTASPAIGLLHVLSKAAFLTGRSIAAMWYRVSPHGRNWAPVGYARRLVVLGILAASAPIAAFAAELPDVRIDAVLEGGGIARATNPGDVAAETIWIKGGRVRVDFDAGEGRRGRILRGGSGHAWLLMSTSHRGLPADNVRLGAITRLDPQQPCRDLPFDCERVETRAIAGRQAQGWRYRYAGQAGPDGTDSGTFWLDSEHGLLLSFMAQDLGGRQHRMETTAIRFGDLPQETFAMPESLRKETGRAESRADELRDPP